jgi:hypothetical protein
MWSGALRMSVVATLALSVSCAAGNKYKPEPMPPRVQDGASDKRAAMRSAAPHQLQLEVEHERWNYEAAEQVKEVEQEKKAAAAKKAAAPTPPGATPQPPPAAPPAPGK